MLHHLSTYAYYQVITDLTVYKIQQLLPAVKE